MSTHDKHVPQHSPSCLLRVHAVPYALAVNASYKNGPFFGYDHRSLHLYFEDDN